MKQKPKLIKRTVFVFKAIPDRQRPSTDPTSTSVTIIATETVRTKQV